MWRLMAGQRLQYRGWDEEFVLYNDLSGDTHLLGAVAIELLAALQRGPATEAALAAALDAAFEAGEPDALARQLPDLLAQLRALYLVEPLAC
jgi:PqqD family protein of HPr-rel-A system